MKLNFTHIISLWLYDFSELSRNYIYIHNIINSKKRKRKKGRKMKKKKKKSSACTMTIFYNKASPIETEMFNFLAFASFYDFFYWIYELF